MTVWMKVTNDDYELPVAVADTAAELSRMLGVSVNTIRARVCEVENGKNKWSKYVKVKLEGDDEE